MNKTYFKQASLFFIFFYFTITAYTQSIKEENSLLNTDQDKFITLSQNGFLPEMNTITDKSTLPNGINTVFIQQIGSGNNVISNIIAESSDIKIYQNGNQNDIEINESAREIEKNIIQSGTNNSVIDFSFNPNISTKLELIQDGNNLIFERFGSNELSKTLKFKMTGEARTIIVRSF
ncbi:hypothetical protein ACSTS3_01365 [Aquimarina muelleri]|uniref:hypothetical protein n=1 Tax=Aquimarina muelleri TaxID=279356 RepID=UPI003F686CAE